MQKKSLYENFREALIDARLTNNRTQSEIAHRLGKPQSFVSKYESGERRLDIVEFMDICRALDINPHTILYKLGVKNDS